MAHEQSCLQVVAERVAVQQSRLHGGVSAQVSVRFSSTPITRCAQAWHVQDGQKHHEVILDTVDEVRCSMHARHCMHCATCSPCAFVDWGPTRWQ